ncbi:MAG: hypothetical protein CMN36_01405 [SAR116 cluster bacterium]|nr:hypothetical protein [SAR116 cluster bacterium]
MPFHLHVLSSRHFCHGTDEDRPKPAIDIANMIEKCFNDDIAVIVTARKAPHRHRRHTDEDAG